jgi:hypothetical protein
MRRFAPFGPRFSKYGSHQQKGSHHVPVTVNPTSQLGVGIDRDESEFFVSPLAQPALEFLSLFKELEVAPTIFDLSQRNPTGLERSPMLRHLIRPIKGLYIFDFGERATHPWMLAVEKPPWRCTLCA